MSATRPSPKERRKSSILRRLTIDMREETYKNADLSDSNSEDEVVNLVPETLLAENGTGALTGKDVFKFHHQKKSGQMAKVASEAAEFAKAKSPKSTKKMKRVSIAPTVEVLEVKRTPRKSTRSSGKAGILKKFAARTPNRMAKRASEADSDFDSDDSLEEDSEDDFIPEEKESSLSEEEESPSKTPVMACKTSIVPKKSQRKVELAEMPISVNDYFMNAQQSATSDHTLSKLETPRMDQAALEKALEGVPNKYFEERRGLYQEYHAKFRRWMYQLCTGYNLLFYGLGSKHLLLDTFRRSMIADYTHLVINGYFPSLTIKQVLGSITEDVIGHEGNFSNPLDQVEFIKKYYTSHEEDLFLIIHNIDGQMLRAERNQNILSLLASVERIHVIASIDHINAPLLWDQTKCSRYRWLWNDVTTYEPYIEETSYENSLLVQQSGVLALSSLIHVMRSLTPNSKQMFYLLANNQLENQGNSNYIGLSKQDLYQRCREAFLVNSDLTLRAHLTEFKDHKLIKIRKGHDGMEYFYIPLDEATLKEFMDQQENGE